MRHLFIVGLFLASLLSTQAQDTFSKISLSGFRVNLIPSEIFSIQLEDSLGIEQEIEDGILEIRVLDQRGRVPKGSITIYTNKLDYLSLHNCQLVMDAPLENDSLTLITGSSFGALKIKSNYLSANIAAGSRFEIEGTTKYYDCAVGAGSALKSSNLLADKAAINAMGYSNVVLNAKEIIRSEVKNANVKNIYE
ncbi:GIN domain-containing protein [Dysgonomonas sp. GY617]|uniref:GIN domain-containing protein n=1 Tax=Dysgonomonas sp. GY617 TaxID=2780420 RepID=UPI001883D3FC|nr:DUF2807 domain-containing protein [Dysgonomonas sp. GY617]MBF0575116.1 DUF2807 domain-containing protein [Dysgonomonas sp. GY617]